MSRSQDIKSNPCVRYFDWNSENGEFKWYDKENKVNVEMNLPVTFAVLDELTTIKGFYEKQNQGVWANEVKNTKSQPLVVRTKDGILLEGLYGDIKDSLDTYGCSYTRSLYVAMEIDGEWQICNFQLKGAAFSGWLEFTKEAKQKVYTNLVTCHNFRNEKKGKVTYTVPEFKLETCPEDLNDTFKQMDSELQEYLKYYFSREKEPVEQDYQ